MGMEKKIGPGVEALPPPGAARKEVLAQRKDALEEAAETEGANMGTIDPEKLQPDRDVLHELYKTPGFSHFDVSERQPGYEYYWASMKKGGLQIKAMKYHGWELVSGSMPEATEHQHVSGARVIADDVALMRIPRARWEQLQRVKELDRLQKQGLYIPDNAVQLEGCKRAVKIRELGKDPVLNQLLSQESYSVTVKQKV